MLSTLPVTKLSMPITLCPRDSSRSTRFEPRKPAAPVTTEVGRDCFEFVFCFFDMVSSCLAAPGRFSPSSGSRRLSRPPPWMAQYPWMPATIPITPGALKASAIPNRKQVGRQSKTTVCAPAGIRIQMQSPPAAAIFGVDVVGQLVELGETRGTTLLDEGDRHS